MKKILHSFILLMLFTGFCQAQTKWVDYTKFYFARDTVTDLLFLTKRTYNFNTNGLEKLSPPLFESGSEFSQNKSVVKVGGKYGYIDTTGAIVIPCKFDNAMGFYDSVAVVYFDCKIGITDHNGTLYFPTRDYSFISSYSDNRGVAKLGDLYAVLDRKAQEVVPPVYSYIHNFDDGFATFKDTINDNLYGAIDTTGKVVIKPIYSYLKALGNSGYFTFTVKTSKGKRTTRAEGVIHKDYGEILPGIYSYVQYSNNYLSNKDNTVLFYGTIGKKRKHSRYRGGHYGWNDDPSADYKPIHTDIVDNKGKKLFSIDKLDCDKIDETVVYSESKKTGLTLYSINGVSTNFKNYIFEEKLYSKFGKHFIFTNKTTGKYGIMGYNGKIAIPDTFKLIRDDDNSNNIYAYGHDSIYVINNKLNIIKRFKGDYFKMRSYEYNLNSKRIKKEYYFLESGGLVSLMDTAFNIVLPYKYNEIYLGSVFKYIKDKKYGLMDTLFNELTPPLYDYIDYQGAYYNQFITKSNGKYGIIKKTGQVLVPPVYDYIKLEDAGYLKNRVCYYSISKDKKTAVADTLGNLLTSFDYTGFYARANSVVVYKNKKVALFTTKLKPITGFDYDAVYNPYENTPYLYAKKDGKYGVIDTTGKVVIAFLYKRTGYNFNEDGLRVCLKKKWGVVDINNKIVVPIEYKYIEHINSGYLVKKDKLFGILSHKGETLVPMAYNDIFSWNRVGLYIIKRKTADSYKVGLVNNQGKIIIAADYNINQFDYFRSTIILSKDGKNYYYNADGEPTNDCYIDKTYKKDSGIFNDYIKE